MKEELEHEDSPTEDEATSEETLEQDRSPSPEEHAQERGNFLQDIPDISDADLGRLILSIEEVMREGFYARPQRQTQLHEAQNAPHNNVRSTFQSVILRGYRSVQQHLVDGSQVSPDRGGDGPNDPNGHDWLMRFLWWLSISSIVIGHLLCVFDYRRQ